MSKFRSVEIAASVAAHPRRSRRTLDHCPITMFVKSIRSGCSVPKPPLSTMAVTVPLVVLLSIWRIAACFTEYDDGPFVPFAVALVDTAPFFTLALGITAFCQRHQPRRMTHYCVRLPGFGRADYLKGDRLQIRGTLRSSEGSHQIAATLNHLLVDLE